MGSPAPSSAGRQPPQGAPSWRGKRGFPTDPRARAGGGKRGFPTDARAGAGGALAQGPQDAAFSRGPLAKASPGRSLARRARAGLGTETHTSSRGAGGAGWGERGHRHPPLTAGTRGGGCPRREGRRRDAVPGRYPRTYHGHWAGGRGPPGEQGPTRTRAPACASHERRSGVKSSGTPLPLLLPAPGPRNAHARTACHPRPSGSRSFHSLSTASGQSPPAARPSGLRPRKRVRHREAGPSGLNVDASLSNREGYLWKLVAALASALPSSRPSLPLNSQHLGAAKHLDRPLLRRGWISTINAPFSIFFPRPPPHIHKSHWLFYYTLYENKTFSRKMVAEKETLSLNKCPAKLPTRTKLLAQQPLPVHQPHSLVSEGFTVKAMMKNSVVSDLPESNALAPSQGTPGCRDWLALGWILSPCPGWSSPKMAIYSASGRRCPTRVWRSRLGC